MIKIYTDGSCLGNPGKGGWAAILQFFVSGIKRAEKTVKGCSKKTTNNIMELTAVIEALKTLKDNAKQHKMIIFTDSQYVQKGVTQWRDSWEYRNFRGVKNAELWKELFELIDKYNKTDNLEIKYVKAHTNDSSNTLDEKTNNNVDKIARNSTENC